MITVILKNLIPVAYANNEEEAKKMIIKKIFENKPYVVETWEHACRLSNCNQIYTFKNLENKL